MTLMRPLKDAKWKTRLGAVRVCMVLALLGGLFGCGRGMPENFDCVEEGVLYRSGQPGAKGLEQIASEYGIKTIVNTRSKESIQKDRRGQEEIQFSRDHGINLLILPYGDMDTDALAERFLKIMDDPANHPVLVHCARGRERSGVLAAVYRIAVNGWTPERAFEEMKSYGFKPGKEPQKTRFVLEYSPAAKE